ncbi:hypothetical protein PR048_023502 [Dryococelus australis]|uniref:YqaJ viral recombinase domain-containing protein n=1 Tax=Dryococelus australis TaxID=614101 RepID=A0ABQ9GU95_9NEOP|nr:hypothetical protein PR048_023502 [Dryococelus australis]
MVCWWKDSTSCCNLAKRLLYKPNIVTPAMEYGIHIEYIAIKRFEVETCLNVNRYGIFVDLECGYLGAIPDGLVREESDLVEVKCATSAKPLGLMATVRQKKITSFWR